MSDELKKNLENLTEEDLRKVSGGYVIRPDGTELVCPKCGSPNVLPNVTINSVYCRECQKSIEI